MDELKGLMVSKRKTQVDIAKVLDVSTNTVSRKMSRRAEFTVGEMWKIVDLLDIPSKDIAKYFR
mgnify:CR=1 FL=1